MSSKTPAKPTGKAAGTAKKTSPGKARPGQTSPGKGRPTPSRAAAGRRRQRSYWPAVIVIAIVVVIGGLYAIYRGSGNGGGSAKGNYPFQVGQPGPGQPAPDFDLAASTGQQVSLSALRGKTVLLYFQEGLTCQPCWDQLTDLEHNSGQVKAAGIDQVVSITTDPIDLITRKTRDEGIHIPVASDPDLSVSRAYHANSYGMMGSSRDGHSFLLLGPDGRIRWRADYGGAPKYTMYVPTARILADLKKGNTS